MKDQGLTLPELLVGVAVPVAVSVADSVEVSVIELVTD